MTDGVDPYVSDAGNGPDGPLTPGDDDAVIAQCLSALGRDPRTVRSGRVLGGAGSGSLVYSLRLDDESAVLKVTTAAAWRERARREVRFYLTLAPLVPLAVPRMLGCAETTEFTGLLITRAQAAPPATEWTTTRWVDVARQLGELHRSATSADAGAGWLPQHTMRVDEAFTTMYWANADATGTATRLLARLPALDAALSALPVCLIHGDCHAGNLLVTARGHLLWADWQEVSIGHGPEDLALLWQRADFDGARPPRSILLAEYALARRLPDDRVLRRAVAAAELRLLLLAWPPFLASADPLRRAVLTRRLPALVRLIDDR